MHHPYVFLHIQLATNGSTCQFWNWTTNGNLSAPAQCCTVNGMYLGQMILVAAGTVNNSVVSDDLLYLL